MEIFCVQSILFLLLPIISLYLLSRFYGSNPASWSRSNGFTLYPIIGNWPGLVANRHRFYDWVAETLTNSPTNTAIFSQVGKYYRTITANPDNVEHMLKTNFVNYEKGNSLISVLSDLLGHGIFNSNGELWRLQRKMASLEFNTRLLRNFAMRNVIVEIQTRLVPMLKEASEMGRTLDLQDVLERFTFDNVCKVVFDVDPDCLTGGGKGEEFMTAFNVAAELSTGRFRYFFTRMWKIKKFFNVGSERRLRESISTVHKFADDIIKSRMKEKEQKERDDLLTRFLGMDEINSPEFLRDILISLILAGKDTTSSALSWFFWVISSRAEVEEKILDELRNIRAQTGKNVDGMYTFEELRDMQYLHAAISESMRLYPPVASNSRTCLNDDVMPDGTFVGKGWSISYNNYAMGRMESIWGKDCREFRPERWLESGVFRPENPFRYPVFHGGPRMCPGRDMAYIQMKTIAALVIERFQVNVVEKVKAPEHLLSLTLKMKGGLPVTITKRHNI